MRGTILAAEGKHQCDNCGKTFPASELRLVKNFFQRLAAGGIVPSGECPACGALCYPVQKAKKDKFREFVKELAKMKTEEEYGEHKAPPSEDLISERDSLIADARELL
jgi:predicted  nucleic acid-binding Zn-ribbon protein